MIVTHIQMWVEPRLHAFPWAMHILIRIYATCKHALRVGWFVMCKQGLGFIWHQSDETYRSALISLVPNPG